MGTLAFDTHAFIKKLEASGFEEKQAEALSAAIKETQEAHLEELATKRDMKELELRLIIKLGTLMTIAIGVVATLVKLL